MNADGPALRFREVKKRFGNVQALKGISFEVPSRSVFGLLGPNGAGKTTLFSITANFLKADAGGIEVLGIDATRSSQLQGRMTILPQDALFQRNMPILEQLTFFRLLDGRQRDEAEAEVKRTLELVGLSEVMHRRVHALSHGMVKRLGIAQAFLGEPEVILLDEPTSGLDPQNARQIRDLVREMQARATVVISSHNLAEIQELCDHVAIMDEGRMVTCGSVREITRAGKTLDLELSRPLNEEEVGRLKDLDGVGSLEQRAPTRYVSRLDLLESDRDPDRVIAAVLGQLLELGVTPRGLREGNSLEEVFLKLTNQENGPGDGSA